MPNAIRCSPPSALRERPAVCPFVRPQYYTSNWWGGIGVNMNIPIFNGFLYSAEAKEATLRAQAGAERSRDLRDRIVRDVRTAWLAANTAFQRVSVTAALLQQANLASDSGADTLSVRVEFHRGAQPGAVPANRRRHRQRQRAISIPPQPRYPQLSNWRYPMIENSKLKHRLRDIDSSVFRRPLPCP